MSLFPELWGGQGMGPRWSCLQWKVKTGSERKLKESEEYRDWASLNSCNTVSPPGPSAKRSEKPHCRGYMLRINTQKCLWIWRRQKQGNADQGLWDLPFCWDSHTNHTLSPLSRDTMYFRDIYNSHQVSLYRKWCLKQVAFTPHLILTKQTSETHTQQSCVRRLSLAGTEHLKDSSSKGRSYLASISALGHLTLSLFWGSWVLRQTP